MMINVNFVYPYNDPNHNVAFVIAILKRSLLIDILEVIDPDI
jgi:hypothetical protein